jgi:hypothetical protein
VAPRVRRALLSDRIWPMDKPAALLALQSLSERAFIEARSEGFAAVRHVAASCRPHRVGQPDGAAMMRGRLPARRGPCPTRALPSSKAVASGMHPSAERKRPVATLLGRFHDAMVDQRE